jgi:NTP pyrophosphatase (non-canonical NTP hydrolase)
MSDRKIAKLERRIESLRRDIAALREIVKRTLAREHTRVVAELEEVRKEIRRERKRDKRKSSANQ